MPAPCHELLAAQLFARLERLVSAVKTTASRRGWNIKPPKVRRNAENKRSEQFDRTGAHMFVKGAEDKFTRLQFPRFPIRNYIDLFRWYINTLVSLVKISTIFPLYASDASVRKKKKEKRDKSTCNIVNGEIFAIFAGTNLSSSCIDNLIKTAG